ncbi:MAG: hypothetical protein LBE49_06250 [Deltaproteobacteria bacterium]|jgi:hypothetical protein|nr:hypothetical protein [Deltaproteobacteria bacterium]
MGNYHSAKDSRGESRPVDNFETPEEESLFEDLDPESGEGEEEDEGLDHHYTLPGIDALLGANWQEDDDSDWDDDDPDWDDDEDSDWDDDDLDWDGDEDSDWDGDDSDGDGDDPDGDGDDPEGCGVDDEGQEDLDWAEPDDDSENAAEEEFSELRQLAKLMREIVKSRRK